MKLSILPGALAEALAVAKSAAGNPKFAPSIGMVLLDASPDGGLTVSATDLSSRAWKVATARVDEPGAVCLPPSGLSEFLTVCPSSDALTLTVNDKHKAELVCGKAQVKLAGLDPETFPVATSFDDPAFDLTLSAPLLADLLAGVAHAFGTTDSREVLAGINLRVRNGRLTLAAADGFRMAVRSADVADAPECDLIVLGSPLAGLRATLAKATSARLVVDARRSALLVDCEGGCWTIRLIDGQFPDFNRIIPAAPTIIVTVGRERFLAAAKLARNIEQTAENNGKRTVTNITRLTVGTDSLRVAAHDDAGDHAAEIELEAEIEGDALAIGFNGAYLADALGALSGDRVRMGLTGPASPGLFTAPDDMRRDNVQVVMPMFVARS